MKTIALIIPMLLVVHLGYSSVTETFGPILDADIVSIYVPPTRADEPYVATSTSLYQYDKAKKSWDKLYSPPWKGSSILGISGYAKSSQMVYVVHSQGIAASRDTGQSWTESIPNGYGRDSGDLVSIMVHPEDRKVATFTFRNACWETGDYGVNFEALLEGKRFAGAVYTPGETGGKHQRIFASDQAVYIDGDSGFITITPPNSGTITRITAHPNKPFAYLNCDKDQMLILNTSTQRGSLVELGPATTVSPIFSSESSLWVYDGKSLSISHFEPAKPPQGFPLVSRPIAQSVVQAHPRQPDSLYFSEGSQLHLLSDGFTNLPSQILAPLNQDTFIPLKRSVQSLEMNQMEAQSTGNASLAALIASQPSLTSTVATAVAYNLHNPETLAEWNRKARSRHWMPELKIAGYAREGTLDVTRLDEYTDRYGIAQTDALRLSDEVRTYNSAAMYLQWNLQELIYDEEQVDVVRERRYQADYRRKLATEITSIYYDRIELLASFKGVSHTSKSKSLSRDQLFLGVRELTDLLNAICGQELFQHLEI